MTALSILPLGTVAAEMRNEPYRYHQPLRSVDDRSSLGVPPQHREEWPLIQYHLRSALPHRRRIVGGFHVDAQ